MLLTQRCGFKPWQAVVVNHMVGFTVMHGAIIILLMDLSDAGVDYILAFPAGVYLYVCGAELIP